MRKSLLVIVFLEFLFVSRSSAYFVRDVQVYEMYAREQSLIAVQNHKYIENYSGIVEGKDSEALKRLQAKSFARYRLQITKYYRLNIGRGEMAAKTIVSHENFALVIPENADQYFVQATSLSSSSDDRETLIGGSSVGSLTFFKPPKKAFALILRIYRIPNFARQR